jgi:hypothetical protein
MVYVNYGRIEDFQYLEKNLSVSVNGCIAIVRYGKIFRGDKVKVSVSEFCVCGVHRSAQPETLYLLVSVIRLPFGNNNFVDLFRNKNFQTFPLPVSAVSFKVKF